MPSGKRGFLCSSFFFLAANIIQILDLRERGSETVAHSDGTGMAAFTTKSVSQQDSPFTPPNPRNKSATNRYRTRGAASTMSTNIVLTTLGSIPPDVEVDVEQGGLELEDIRLGLNLHLGNLNTAIGGDDGEPIADNESHGGSPAPAYNSLEMGIRGLENASVESGVAGIRIDVETATSDR